MGDRLDVRFLARSKSTIWGPSRLLSLSLPRRRCLQTLLVNPSVSFFNTLPTVRALLSSVSNARAWHRWRANCARHGLLVAACQDRLEGPSGIRGNHTFAWRCMHWHLQLLWIRLLLWSAQSYKQRSPTSQPLHGLRDLLLEPNLWHFMDTCSGNEFA